MSEEYITKWFDPDKVMGSGPPFPSYALKLRMFWAKNGQYTYDGGSADHWATEGTYIFTGKYHMENGMRHPIYLCEGEEIIITKVWECSELYQWGQRKIGVEI